MCRSPRVRATPASASSVSAAPQRSPCARNSVAAAWKARSASARSPSPSAPNPVTYRATALAHGSRLSRWAETRANAPCGSPSLVALCVIHSSRAAGWRPGRPSAHTAVSALPADARCRCHTSRPASPAAAISTEIAYSSPSPSGGVSPTASRSVRAGGASVPEAPRIHRYVEAAAISSRAVPVSRAPTAQCTAACRSGCSAASAGNSSSCSPRRSPGSAERSRSSSVPAWTRRTVSVSPAASSRSAP